MELANLIQRLGLSIGIVVLWFLAALKTFMLVVTHGTSKYIGRNLIVFLGMMFLYVIYPLIFMYSVIFNNPKNGSRILLYSVSSYAIILIICVIIDKLVGPVFVKNGRTEQEEAEAWSRSIRR